jgi:hypothetical protein
MTADVDKEWQYIRYCIEKLEIILQRQQYLQGYKPGNILLVHLEFGRTPEKFEKPRRYWNRVAEFIGYHHGNVMIRLLSTGKTVVIPIYYTKFIANDVKSIPRELTSTYQTLVPTGLRH